MAGKISFVSSVTLGLLLLSVSNHLAAQELPIVNLQEVEIRTARISDYAVGSSSQQIDSALLQVEQTGSLADIMRNYTGAHIKAHGNGMLSSISFRGTGPEHTAVLWHGINISYPMLGQSDFSVLPIALNDQIIIQRGTGASLYGSGALGGTVALGMLKPKSGVGMQFSQYLGSYNTSNTQIKANYANNKFYINVKGFLNSSENNFTFRNLTKLGEPLEQQKNAAFEIAGIALESALQLNEKSEIQLSGQYLDASRNLQPSMNSSISDIQEDINSRIRVAYQYKSNRTRAKVQYAYLNDNIAFNDQSTQSKQQVIRAEIEQHLIPGLKLNMAGDYADIKVYSPFFGDSQTQEYRSNIWLGTVYTPASWLLLSLNLRQGFHPVFTAPLAPSLGAEFYVLKNKTSSLQINSLVAKGFRLPTLNELYWEPGGNLNLVPEESYSAEIGLSGARRGNVQFNYSLTGYRMWVDNWIIWQPAGSFWSPQNIKEVDVYGIEASGSVTHKLGSIEIGWTGTYALTHSINRTGIDDFDRSVNKQLSYVPLHKGNITAQASWQSWQFVINTDFTGERFTTSDNESALPAYSLINLRASKTFNLNKYSFTGNLSINNLLNTSYQSVVNKAMPGINFLAGITLSYHKP
jgi:outer membrane cobalamin receptor